MSLKNNSVLSVIGLIHALAQVVLGAAQFGAEVSVFLAVAVVLVAAEVALAVEDLAQAAASVGGVVDLVVAVDFKRYLSR